MSEESLLDPHHLATCGPAELERSLDLVLEWSDRVSSRRAAAVIAGMAANPHLTFGHGRHYCPGAGLARFEMQALFSQLLTRFPTMRLAVRPEELRSHDDQITGGLLALPVTW